ncbi:VWA domain-containing protein [bacterium]|nr:VWA domain-containing protein [bacterium]
MRKKFILSLCLFSFLLTGIGMERARGDGFIIPLPRPGEEIPPLTVKYHRVHVKITDQAAQTTIDQVFVNNYPKDIEGEFIFPLPEGAAISEFSLYVGGKKVEGEVLDSKEARRVYEDIVRRLKDPALLEYAGRNMFRARIYPIPGGGEKRVKLSYTEMLKAEHNLVRYVYPLDTERFSLKPLKEVTVSVELSSKSPLTNIYSPTHKVSVRRQDKGTASVSYEDQNVKPDKDFVLYYSLSEDDIGLSFMNWKSYFMFLASPSYVQKKKKILQKDLIFVIDSSGSMKGKKIEQVKEAARFVIHHLKKEDRFSLVDFDDGVDVFSSNLLPATPANKEKALRFVEEIEDAGGTNINEALLRALKIRKSEERPRYILFLTDGRPTVGITDTARILGNIRESNPEKARMMVFGVGYDVNTELLDRLSLENKGTSVYIGEDENLEVGISHYYEKISSPVLSHLEVDFKGIEVKDSYPRMLPDLFKGTQLVMVGRCTGSGPVEVVLSGKVGEKEKHFRLQDQELTEEEGYNFLPRLWASRRVGYLLEEIRLHGEKEELVEEVKRLGTKYGIVTPYTSFLVTEEERQSLDMVAPEAAQAFEARKVTGKGAVQLARATQSLKAVDQGVEVSSQKIRYKENKTFYLKDGMWVDSDYKEGASLKEIEFNTPEYFDLLSRKPELAEFLSVGSQMIVCYQGTNYKILPGQDKK